MGTQSVGKSTKKVSFFNILKERAFVTSCFCSALKNVEKFCFARRNETFFKDSKQCVSPLKGSCPY